MTRKEVLKELEGLGTGQNRKIYARQGVTGPQYGVSYANLGKLQKRLRRNHGLALQLWDTGNHDARILALKIADPEKTSAKLVEAWARDCDNPVLADALSGYIVKTRFAARKREQWTRAKGELRSVLGWNLVAHAALESDEDDGYFHPKLEEIESGIHEAPNRTRHAMNMALIAIGLRNPVLEKAALGAAARIGNVEVDHGETSCTTPDAAAYIVKARARAANRRRKQKVGC